MTTITAPAGIWTPHGELLCAACHDNLTADWKRDIDPASQQEGHAAICDHCHVEVATSREDVALCSAFVHAYNAAASEADKGARLAHLWQTGGMCVAAGLAFPDGAHVMVTDAESSEDPALLLIGRYEGAEDEEPAEWHRMRCPEAVQLVLSWAGCHGSEWGAWGSN